VRWPLLGYLKRLRGGNFGQKLRCQRLAVWLTHSGSTVRDLTQDSSTSVRQSIVCNESISWHTAVQSVFAHAYRGVRDAQLLHALDHRQEDDNRRRHVGVFASYDWCWGEDDQWLYSDTEEQKLYSHDHGWYFPEDGPDWSEATLTSRVDDAHVPNYSKNGLDPGALRVPSGGCTSVPDQKCGKLCLLVSATLPRRVWRNTTVCLGEL
jgi:hypothetical protein